MSEYGYVDMSAGTSRGKKKVSNTLELELQAVKEDAEK